MTVDSDDATNIITIDTVYANTVVATVLDDITYDTIDILLVIITQVIW